MLKYLIIVILVTFLQCSTHAASEPADSPIKDWSMEKANPYYCALHAARDYDIVLKVSKSDEVKVMVQKDGKDIFSFSGHKYSVFAIFVNTFFYVDYGVGLTGGTVIAIDLTTGKKLWATELQGAPVKKHSIYENYINIEVKPEGIEILGSEGDGDYAETLDPKTGKQLSHVARERVLKP